MNKINILVFPIESDSGRNVYESLKYNIHFNVYGVSIRSAHADYLMPSDRLKISNDFQIANNDFLNIFNKQLEEWNIKFIIPTHDTIARYLIENQDNILATVVCSPLETTKIAEDKYLTYQYLKDCWYYPKTYNSYDDIVFPVFLKPYVAAGGKGTYKVNNSEELETILNINSELLICEYLPGKEYTIDCFTNSKGDLLFAGARTRERITQGVTYMSSIVDMNEELNDIANDLNKRFKFRGAWFFQVKENSEGKMRLMEFSVRQAGTMAFYRQLGVNFAALSLFDFMGMPVTVLYNKLDLKLDRGTETLYNINYDYDVLYIDYDDTLIVNNKVNSTMIKLIYQCINKGIKVVLITKHIGDLQESLYKYKLHESIFDDIILLKPDELKSDYIAHEKAVFIDNYFPERYQVRDKCGIPVFDVDAAECLIDKRIL